MKNINENLQYGRGYVYDLRYHIVWCTRYRKEVLVGQIAEDTKTYLQKFAEEMNIDILAMEVMPDHIHLFISCRPQIRLSDILRTFKGTIARWLFLDHPELKQSLWGGHLWNPSYFTAIASDRSEAQIQYYIEHQRTEAPRPRKKK